MSLSQSLSGKVRQHTTSEITTSHSHLQVSSISSSRGAALQSSVACKPSGESFASGVRVGEVLGKTGPGLTP